ncbi:MAG: dephospho-CoA kinase [Acidobacteriota bacterium]|jgi:dephospho-CoA kinase|nr:dephospho-CoA kinase [Acidobacteriota bacterium]
MLRVGLTGSIGVGKSVVSSVFAALGCFVLDADQTSREVVAVGSRGLAEVVEAFGNDILQLDGALDRGRMRDIIFTDENKRQLLNSILHPFIIAAQDELLRDWEAKEPDGIAIVDAALMIESGGYRRFDKLVVVHCSPEIQIERLMARNRISREEAERRVNAQMPQDEKVRFADFLIDTSFSLEDTKRRTLAVYHKLTDLLSGHHQEVVE